MKLRLVWVGRTRNPAIASIHDDYVARLRHLLPVEVVEVREPRTVKTAQARIAEETERILAALTADDYAVVLDPAGKTFTSEQFAAFMNRHLARESRHLTFVIGGFAGISGKLLDRASLRWSLSPLTLTHELTRAVVTEQLYRAMSILRNLPFAH